MFKFYSAACSGIVHPDGKIQRTDVHVAPSDSWVCTGAVEFRFGRVVKRYSLAELLAGKVPAEYKNGKQRAFLTDVDHGTGRIMLSPRMRFSPAAKP